MLPTGPSFRPRVFAVVTTGETLRNTRCLGCISRFTILVGMDSALPRIIRNLGFACYTFTTIPILVGDGDLHAGSWSNSSNPMTFISSRPRFIIYDTYSSVCSSSILVSYKKLRDLARAKAYNTACIFNSSYVVSSGCSAFACAKLIAY